VWRLTTDTPEKTVNLIDLRYTEDALTPDEALHILRENYASRGQHEAELLAARLSCLHHFGGMARLRR